MITAKNLIKEMYYLCGSSNLVQIDEKFMKEGIYVLNNFLIDDVYLEFNFSKMKPSNIIEIFPENKSVLESIIFNNICYKYLLYISSYEMYYLLSGKNNILFRKMIVMMKEKLGFPIIN